MSSPDEAAERNKRPIFDALVPWLAQARRVLEVGAGDATHARYAHARLPDLIWQTSEAPGHHRRLRAALADCMAGYPADGGDPRLPPPLVLDVRGAWPADVFDAIYGANVVHIMDWAAVQALFAGAGRQLAEGGLLCLYGPFLEAGVTPAAGNARFDATLRAQDPAMGLREIGELDALAEKSKLRRVADIAMPANNRLLLWRRAAG